MFRIGKCATLRAGLAAGAVLIVSFNAIYAAAQTSATPASDRAHIEEALKGMSRGHAVGQVAVSPDGQRLAWVEGAPGGTEISLAPISDLKKSERVTAAAKASEVCQEDELAWAPDSRALAFFSDCAQQGEQSDLYLAQIDGKLDKYPARRLTTLKGYVDAPSFSPNGSQVAFLYVEGATRPAGALAAIKPWSGVIGEDGVEIQRIAVAQADAEQPLAWATPANLHVYEFDWRPDSRGFAYIAANPPGENNWWVAKLYSQLLGAGPQMVLDPAKNTGPLHGLQIAVPRWSPDGKSLAFIGGLMSDQGATGGDLWMIPSEGGAPRNLSEGRKASAAWMVWENSEQLLVSELRGGNSQLVRYRLTDGSVRIDASLYSIPATVSDGRLEMSLSASADRSLLVFRASTFEHPSEIYAVKPGAPGPKQLSHFNDGIVASWGKSISLTWKSDEFNVQGWLTQPQGYDPSKRYPLIILVHGGPAAAVTSEWGARGSLSAAAFSALGYFVLQPNPRGSFGQGEAFTQANRKDFGYGDLRDILAGVDTVLAQYPVDKDRVGITGWSYGGFMTMFAITQTGRFKAAVAGAGISNWQSYYGENSINQWMLPYFGASVYDDPAIYAKSSAINYLKNATTPTLVVVGDRDGECPAPQSFEFWHALRERGVPTQLVVYPNEGHGFVDPDHRRDVVERAAEWFGQYLTPTVR